MRKRLARLLRRIVRRWIQEETLPAAAANQTGDKITPKEAMIIFELVRDLVLEVVVIRYPGFDLNVVRTRDRELYWKLISFGVRVEMLREPVDRDQFQAFMKEYFDTFGSVAGQIHDQTVGD